MKYFFWLFISIAILSILSCNNEPSQPASDSGLSSIPSISYSIIASFPHDTASFTEGIEFYNNNLLESTGNPNNNNASRLLEVDLKSGKPLKQVHLDNKFFGEGITALHDTIYQLTYKEHTVFLYSAKDFKKLKEFTINNNEGWGMTNDGKNIIASDGSSNLYFYEPGTFKLQHIQGVTENGSPVININELEYIKGFIYSNQWEYNYILKIDPKTGQVVAKIDLTDIVNKIKVTDTHADVLNGIAYNPATDKIYVTGKYWPVLYEIQFPH